MSCLQSYFFQIIYFSHEKLFQLVYISNNFFDFEIYNGDIDHVLYILIWKNTKLGICYRNYRTCLKDIGGSNTDKNCRDHVTDRFFTERRQSNRQNNEANQIDPIDLTSILNSKRMESTAQ